jgi:ribosomal protein S27E
MSVTVFNVRCPKCSTVRAVFPEDPNTIECYSCGQFFSTGEAERVDQVILPISGNQDPPDHIRWSLRLLVTSLVLLVLWPIVTLLTLNNGWQDLSMADREQTAAKGVGSIIFLLW